MTGTFSELKDLRNNTYYGLVGDINLDDIVYTAICSMCTCPVFGFSHTMHVDGRGFSLCGLHQIPKETVDQFYQIA